MITAATGADRGAEELDIPALSTYEHRAVLSEIACDIANDFETGVGADMRAYLNFLAGGTAVLATEEGEEAEATIRVTTHEGEASGASIDIVAAPNSTFSIALSLDSDADAPAFMAPPCVCSPVPAHASTSRCTSPRAMPSPASRTPDSFWTRAPA